MRNASLAAAAALEGRAGRAVRLWAAADALHETAGSRRLPRARRYEPHIAAMRARLGEDACARAEAEGRAMTPEQAVAYALADAVEDAAPPAAPLPEPLTARELEVLRLMAAGHGNAAIAARLSVAVSTVKTDVNAIFGKLGATSRTQAVARARALGLLAD